LGQKIWEPLAWRIKQRFRIGTYVYFFKVKQLSTLFWSDGWQHE